MTTFPTIRQVVLDAVDIRALAEFYRELFGLEYRSGDEPEAGEEGTGWCCGRQRRPARVPAGGELPAVTWPEGPIPQQLHLDTTVPDAAELDVQHERALGLGARLLLDRSDDPEEPLRVYADPAGHPFCIFVG